MDTFPSCVCSVSSLIMSSCIRLTAFSCSIDCALTLANMVALWKGAARGRPHTGGRIWKVSRRMPHLSKCAEC
eukprot:5504732-Prymnesium_polylepis.2